MKPKHKLAIHELLSRAAYYFDEHDVDGLQACFAEEAKMLVEIIGGDTYGPFENRDAIMELMRGTLEMQTDRRKHVICNFVFESGGNDEATVVSTVVVTSVENDAMNLVTSGVYRDVVRRVDGEWLISNRHLVLDRGF